MKLRGEAVLPASSLLFCSFRSDCAFVFGRFSHITGPKEIAVWIFLPNIARGLEISLYIALAGDDAHASLDESGNSDRGSSSSSHFSEKLGDDDHAMRFDVKEILRRKLQGKTKSMFYC